MNRNFERALSAVRKYEGGYADHPSDPGGATNMGITLKTLAAWRKVTPWWRLAKSEVKALTKSEAAEIYKANYWDEISADKLPDGLDLALFDFAVNSGPSRAVITLQTLLGVAADGKVGPITLAAIGKASIAHLVNELCSNRLAFLERLSTWPTFGKGWSARVKAVRSEALNMVPQTNTPPTSPPAASIPVAPIPVTTTVDTDKPKSGAGLLVAGIAVVVILALIAVFTPIF